MKDIRLLDCTLRDGGYINDWNWGYQKAKEIIHSLVKAGVEIIEVGFLRDTEKYCKDISVCNRIEELKKLLPKDQKNTMFSAMAMHSNYDVRKLSQWTEKGIDMVRITTHDYDIEKGMDFAAEVKNRGYLLSINPINIMGYSDDRILWIIDQVNQIMPYQFSIVDTFGSMKPKDLDRIASLVDHNLDKSIRVGIHLHENMAQSFSLAQRFLDKHLDREITIDASLMGMGRIPGNLSIELMAEYLNEYHNKNYDINYMMDAIHDYIEPIKKKESWGYTPTYFLSAKYNLHRNYAEFYLNKGDLTNRDINYILARIKKEKRTAFDAEYAEELYRKYQDHRMDDQQDRQALKKKIQGKKILVLAPGKSITEQEEKVRKYIAAEKPAVIGLNFVPENCRIDLAFFSNQKRYEMEKKYSGQIIATSNLEGEKADYTVDYNSLTGAFRQGCNSLIMLLKLLEQLGVKEVSLAGADGYQYGEENYCDTSFVSAMEHGREFNQEVGEALNALGLKTEFITHSQYERYMNERTVS